VNDKTKRQESEGDKGSIFISNCCHHVSDCTQHQLRECAKQDVNDNGEYAKRCEGERSSSNAANICQTLVQHQQQGITRTQQ
jgi:hypothetical protein